MKNNIKYIKLFIIVIIFNACTGDFENINTDPNGISQGSLTQLNNHIGSRFSPIFANIIRTEPAWNYQLQHGLNGDVFSGYMTSPTPICWKYKQSNLQLWLMVGMLLFGLMLMMEVEEME